MKKVKVEERSIINISEVAKMMGVSVSQVRRLIRGAGLPHAQLVKRGRLYFVKEVVMAWWAEHSKGGTVR